MEEDKMKTATLKDFKEMSFLEVLAGMTTQSFLLGKELDRYEFVFNDSKVTIYIEQLNGR